ncbi:MAG: hypothetical protein HZA18_02090 [Nitrospirae bacterium]|nr:hypothetical protein [Nitrospirota bacterium]
MDRYHRKKDRDTTTKLKMTVVLGGILILSLWSDRIYAEAQKEKDKRIELEKEEIVGILERPNVLFPIRWKDTEVPEERSYGLQRSFKEEIFEFVDMETIKRLVNGKQ